MTTTVFDPSWYRVANLRPRIRKHAQFHRHDYRGDVWHVLQDHSSERFHRFSPAAYHVIGLMDGRRPVQQIWDQAIRGLGDDAPTQSEVIQILSHLHTADVLQCDVTPDTAELLQRHQKRKRQTRLQRIKSPLAIRIPLFDPERLLARLEWLARPFFNGFGFLLWLTIVVSAGVAAVSHWPELSENVTERVLAPQNLVLLWFSFVVVKALHELGHGLATKVWGGEVHEMGIMLLVLMPIPYVEASAASAFRERRRRAVVGAAGMIVELLLASIAMFVWLAVEPGLVRTIAYNVMLIAGISTVLFNGNPLLRFDGYYILADLLNMPNLASRSNRYLYYLIQRYAFGAEDAQPPHYTRGERFWFVTYGIASFLYRLFIYAVIILFVAGEFFFIGVLLAIWAGFSMVVQPLFKGLKFVLTDKRIRKQRGRAVSVTLATVALIALAILVLPLPHATRAEGVVWVPERSIVRLDTEGFVERLLVPPGSQVRQGQPLLQLSDPQLPVQLQVVEEQLAETRARRRALQVTDLVQAEITDGEIERLEARAARVRERIAALQVVAPLDGVFILPRAEDLPGRFFRQGEQLAYVVEDVSTARVVIEQGDVDLVLNDTQAIEVRPASHLDRIIQASLKREVPAATNELPSLALGSAGGGAVAVDPRDTATPKAVQSLFQVDLALQESADSGLLGGRLFVRFDHGLEPLGVRWYRSLRQLLLGRFSV
jgi:putative peptide zinc metalloprotease protein